MAARRKAQADYDARYDITRARFTVTDLDGRSVRVGHTLNPQTRGTVEARKEEARRLAQRLMESVGRQPIDAKALVQLFRNSTTVELLRAIRDRGPGAIRQMATPQEHTVAGHYQRIYRPILEGSPEWRTRQDSMLKTHVFPVVPPGRRVPVGELTPMQLTEDDCRAVKVAIQAKSRLSKSYRASVWVAFAAYVTALRTSDHPSIRVRQDNPIEHVDAIRGGKGKELQHLWKEEAWQLWASDKPDVEWQRATVVMVLLALRPGEVAPLEASDIRLDKGLVRVARKQKYSSATKAWIIEDYTKSKRVRWVRIAPNLVPLLEALCRRRPKGSLFPVMAGEHHPPKYLRDSLLAAGVDRHELHNGSTTSRQIRAHDLRATGATWLYQLGWDDDQVKRHLGHNDVGVTAKYIRERLDLDSSLGDPLNDPLPARLWDGIGGRQLTGVVSGSGEGSEQGRSEDLRSEGSSGRARSYHSRRETHEEHESGLEPEGSKRFEHAPVNTPANEMARRVEVLAELSPDHAAVARVVLRGKELAERLGQGEHVAHLLTHVLAQEAHRVGPEELVQIQKAIADGGSEFQRRAG